MKKSRRPRSRPDSRITRLPAAMLCFALALGALACASAQAKPKAPPPKSVIELAIDLHNGSVGDMSKFAQQAQTGQKECVTVQGEEPPQQWQQVEFAGKSIQLIEKDDLKKYNKQIPEWIAALERVIVHKKAQRNEKQEAISDLTRAHDAHGKEFFEFGAIGAALQSHDCESALEHLETAKELGDAIPGGSPQAWGYDGLGLLAAAELMGIKTAKISQTVQPYKHAGL